MRPNPNLFITLFLFSQTCSQNDLYEVKEDEKGKLIRLNKRSGDYWERQPAGF
jgi:hypothetical protein